VKVIIRSEMRDDPITRDQDQPAFDDVIGCKQRRPCHWHTRAVVRGRTRDGILKAPSSPPSTYVSFVMADNHDLPSPSAVCGRWLSTDDGIVGDILNADELAGTFENQPACTWPLFVWSALLAFLLHP
jgi:hypothetical protein